MAKSISGLFQDTSRKTKRDATPEPIIKVIADERTNSLIVLASEADTAKIRELIKLLDREPDRGEGDVRVYYLQNAKAEDMAKVLMAIPVAPAGREQEKGKTPILSK
ncbi:MAG: type II secretion system protein GspD, partial [Deltaproteobacteria bacterium CG_4_10_14_3_um_filter_51_14]